MSSRPNAAAPRLSQGLRAKLAEAVSSAATAQHVQQLIDNVFETTKATKVTCPDCGTEFKAKLPDVRQQVASIVELLEQAEGKASQEPQADTVVIIERPAR